MVVATVALVQIDKIELNANARNYTSFFPASTLSAKEDILNCGHKSVAATRGQKCTEMKKPSRLPNNRCELRQCPISRVKLKTDQASMHVIDWTKCQTTTRKRGPLTSTHTHTHIQLTPTHERVSRPDRRAIAAAIPSPTAVQATVVIYPLHARLMQ